MLALSKLATRCPEVMNRVILALTKIFRQHAGTTTIDSASRRAVLERALLLLNTLKQPAVAAAVLSAPSKRKRRQVLWGTAEWLDFFISIVVRSAERSPFASHRRGPARCHHYQQRIGRPQT
jgi:hypothetical protein